MVSTPIEKEGGRLLLVRLTDDAPPPAFGEEGANGPEYDTAISGGRHHIAAAPTGSGGFCQMPREEKRAILKPIFDDG